MGKEEGKEGRERGGEGEREVGREREKGRQRWGWGVRYGITAAGTPESHTGKDLELVRRLCHWYCAMETHQIHPQHCTHMKQ